MKIKAGILGLFVIGFLVFWFGREGGPKVDRAGLERSQQKTDPNQEEVRVVKGTPFVEEFGKEGVSELRELELVQSAFQIYLQYVKEDYRQPFGDNLDLVDLLTGNNAYGVAIIPPDHARLDGEGRLTDRRGVPLMIHPLSSTAIEVVAAGQDGRFGTEDDLKNVSARGEEIRRKVLGLK